MFSFSKVKCFSECGYKFKLKYIDKLEPKDNMDPASPLFEGTSVHEGIETRSIEKAIENYKANFPVITKAHEVEALKITEALKKAIVQIPEGEYEHKLIGKDGFIGFIDELVENEDGTYDLLDFKFSNNVSKYKRSAQVHIYKYYFESLTGNKVRDMYYVFIPKYSDNLLEAKLNYTDEDIKNMVENYYTDKDVKFEKIRFDPQQVELFFKEKYQMDNATEYEKKPSPMCKWCSYFGYCSTNGEDTSGLIMKEPEPEVSEVSLF